MIEQLIFCILLFYGIDGIASKHNWSQKLGELSNRIGSKLLYEVSECRFCFTHHLSIIPVAASVIFFGFEYYLLFFPLMIAGLDSRLKL